MNTQTEERRTLVVMASAYHDINECLSAWRSPPPGVSPESAAVVVRALTQAEQSLAIALAGAVGRGYTVSKPPAKKKT